MSDSSSIARPYAQAVFELAKETGRFEDWSNQLEMLSEIAEHPDFNALVSDPRITREQVLSVVLEITGEHLNAQAQNFVKILSHYRRLSALPLIAKQFESLRAEDEGVIEAELEAAYELDSEQQAQLIEALQQRMGRKVRLTSQINKDLIGGVVVRAGDWVIDGSIRARLDKLASSLGV